jgi:sugar fermentation stimulation protein A
MKLFEIENAVDCRIIGRVNRFVVDVEVDGRRERAYINDTGRLKELIFEGNVGKCLTKRGGKLSYRLFAVSCEGGYALIDTQLQMRAFEVAIPKISWLDGEVRRNVKVGNSIIDYRIGESYVELKSAALKKGIYAMYPDCPTARGRKHLRLLEEIGKRSRALVVFVAALPSVRAFMPNREGDEELYRLIKRSKNVEFRSIQVEYLNGKVFLRNPDLKVVI